MCSGSGMKPPNARKARLRKLRFVPIATGERIAKYPLCMKNWLEESTCSLRLQRRGNCLQVICIGGRAGTM